jgi:hypothetical protein
LSSALKCSCGNLPWCFVTSGFQAPRAPLARQRPGRRRRERLWTIVTHGHTSGDPCYGSVASGLASSQLCLELKAIVDEVCLPSEGSPVRAGPLAGRGLTGESLPCARECHQLRWIPDTEKRHDVDLS